MSNTFLNILKTYFIILFIFIILIPILFIPTIYQSFPTNFSENKQFNYQIIGTSNNIIWPVPGYTRISSYFGYRKAPTIGATSFHGGIDIPAPPGTNIVSAISGKVIRASFMGSGGCTIIIENNNYTIIYHHVSPNYIVFVGDFVLQGQVISQVGPKNVYGFQNNPYKDNKRKSNQWCYYWTTFTFYS